MKAVILKILISFVITYLGVSFLDWDLQWYQKFELVDARERLILGFGLFLILFMVYYTIDLIESFI